MKHFLAGKPYDPEVFNRLQTSLSHQFGLTLREAEECLGDDVTLRSLQAILIREHNKVAAQHTILDSVEQVRHMRQRMIAVAEQEGTSFPTSVALISEEMKSEQQNWCGLGDTAWNNRVKLSLMDEECFGLFESVVAAHSACKLKGMTKGSEKPFAIKGLESLVIRLGSVGIKSFFHAVLEKQVPLSQCSSFCKEWIFRTRKSFKFVDYIILSLSFVPKLDISVFIVQ